MQPYVHKKFFCVSCKCRDCKWFHRTRTSKYLKVAARRLAKKEIEEIMYDYRQEIGAQREIAKGCRARAEELRLTMESQISYLEDMAKRAEVLADHIQLLCTRK